METFLNLAWAMLAIAGVCLWARVERRSGAERRLPLIALAMLVVILFPVISVSDDLWSIQNPAETDSCLRRDHPGLGVHSIFLDFAAFAVPSFVQFPLNFVKGAPTFRATLCVTATPAMSEIENRPPPVG
jgi:hypothetical protein